MVRDLVGTGKRAAFVLGIFAPSSLCSALTVAEPASVIGSAYPFLSVATTPQEGREIFYDVIRGATCRGKVAHTPLKTTERAILGPLEPGKYVVCFYHTAQAKDLWHSHTFILQTLDNPNF